MAVAMAIASEPMQALGIIVKYIKAMYKSLTMAGLFQS